MDSFKVKGTVIAQGSGDAYTAALQRDSDLSLFPAGYVVQLAAYIDILAYASNSLRQDRCRGRLPGRAHMSALGVVTDLRNLNKVVLADDKESISVHGGAYGGDVYEVTSKAHVDVVFTFPGTEIGMIISTLHYFSKRV
uniref:Zn(2)-C6 fungal-type domain-containing protein n=1 Tax=Ganoderma boninense TaxID=34458 RepID=A0A5K1K0X0_9APHY|nr:Zn(2)-C6 fungal-type domain-containing protein [Ganoderma boninense]